MKFHNSILIGLLALSGCATHASIDEQMGTWGGSNISDVVYSWGPPTSIFTDPDGSQWYTWKWDQDMSEAYRHFKVVDGKITSYRWTGPNFITWGWKNIGKP